MHSTDEAETIEQDEGFQECPIFGWRQREFEVEFCSYKILNVIIFSERRGGKSCEKGREAKKVLQENNELNYFTLVIVNLMVFELENWSKVDFWSKNRPFFEFKNGVQDWGQVGLAFLKPLKFCQSKPVFF